MEEEIRNLKLEIEILKKRISSLEAIERRRNIVKIIKGVLILAVIIVVAIFAYKWYQEVMDFVNQTKNIINNPFQSFF